jgi:preprotein translocase subunit YajC
MMMGVMVMMVVMMMMMWFTLVDVKQSNSNRFENAGTYSQKHMQANRVN